MKHVRRETAELLLLLLTKMKAINYIKSGKPRMQEGKGEEKGEEGERKEEARRGERKGGEEREGEKKKKIIGLEE